MRCLAFRKRLKKLIDQRINEIIEMRNRLDQSNLEYLQLIFLKYKDGAPMMTIGGILVDGTLKKKILKRKLFDKYSFMSCDERLFDIDIPKLTNKEIQLILKNLPISREEYDAQMNMFYGIEYEEVFKFEKIYRYYPYYSEGFFRT